MAGCTTGEEAYSIAMILKEFFDQNAVHPEVQIFATDLDERAINIARTGVYSQGIVADVASPRLERYFTFKKDHFHINKRIRDMIVFAVQDLTADPPFLNLGLIICRNLLIYMNSTLQQRVLPMFHYILKHDGLLLLGPSEILGNCDYMYRTLDRK